jgi:hypothetical protein
MKKQTLLLSLFICLFGSVFSQQRDIEKEALGISMIDFHYTVQFPSWDMASRFGINSAIGGGFAYKTKSNWIFGIEFNYMFGQKIKQEDSLLWDLEVHPGDFIISGSGGSAEVRLHERGVNGFLKFGKLIPVLSPNPNSGFFATIGIGYMGYKIKIDNVSGTVPIFVVNSQGKNDYIKGYDRLSGGVALQETFGYMYMSNNRLLNMFLAVDFIQGFTKNMRKYEFDRRQYASTAIRYDYLSGIRFGWIFTIYQRPPKEFYYN